jgi:hypothetical protein
MRPLPLVLALLAAWTPPRIAAACSWNPCLDLGRWDSVELHSVAPLPRDGAFIFRPQGSWRSCLADVAGNLEVLVTRAGEPVPGELVQYIGLDDTLVWRPAELLAASATYELRITLDNAAIAETTEDSLSGKCGPDQLIAEFSLVAGPDLTEVPDLAAPALAAIPVVLDTDLRAVACCPDVTPEWSNGGCEAEVYWFPEARCTLLHGLTGLHYTVTPPALPDATARQYAWQMTVDGELVARDLDPTFIDAFHATAACARFEALHLGTGKIVASLESCPTPELAAALGPHSVADELPCDDPVLCAANDYTWEGPCTPYDPQNPPTPPRVDPRHCPRHRLPRRYRRPRPRRPSRRHPNHRPRRPRHRYRNHNRRRD